MTNASVSMDKNEKQPVRDAQEPQHCVFNAIELALSLGDFQKQIDHPIDPLQFIKLTTERIDEMIRFDMRPSSS